jgi:hypothetical protein
MPLSFLVILPHAHWYPQLPNFVKGMDGQLREGSPKDITTRDTLGFMVCIKQRERYRYQPFL